MALLTAVQMQNWWDKLSAIWETQIPQLGSSADVPSVAGTGHWLADGMRAQLLLIQDSEVETDLLPAAINAFNNITIDNLLGLIDDSIFQLEVHCQKRGSEVAASINSLATFLAYYAGGLGGAKFSSMLCPAAQAVWKNHMLQGKVGGSAPVILAVPYVMSPYIGAKQFGRYGVLNASGMASRAVGGSFAAGSNVDTTQYANVQLSAFVTVSFSGGGAPPAITATGLDDLGNAAQTWTGTFGSNNPVASYSDTISSGAVAVGRQTVTVGATATMAPGLYTINSGLPDQEVVLVEAVPTGSTFTAVFRLAHLASATVTGNTGIKLTPTGAGRRCSTISNLVLTLSGHAAGTVRVDGLQDRCPA